MLRNDYASRAKAQTSGDGNEGLVVNIIEICVKSRLTIVVIVQIQIEVDRIRGEWKGSEKHFLTKLRSSKNLQCKPKISLQSKPQGKSRRPLELIACKLRDFIDRELNFIISPSAHKHFFLHISDLNSLIFTLKTFRERGARWGKFAGAFLRVFVISLLCMFNNHEIYGAERRSVKIISCTLPGLRLPCFL